MVQDRTATLDTVFHALADPTRRAVLRSLASRPHNIGELASPFAMSFAAVSKHVRVLEKAGLVQRRVEGREHICRLEPKPLATASEWIRFYEKFWNEQLDALEALLAAEDAAAATASPESPAKSRSSSKSTKPNPKTP